ncbi:MAG: TlpA family protein disulfide reductase [Candidatus Sungbacteria bacterium]|nr:TlpA family protein disulfide reductase [Candidatus Sungbacteria bacterium]
MTPADNTDPGRGYGIIGIVVAAVLIFVFLRLWNRQADTAVLYRQAPGFALQDYNGREVKLSDFRGKAVLINVWSSWCPFCKEELLVLAEVQKEFGDKITIAAIDRTEPLEIAKKYSDQLGITDKFIFLLDPSDVFYQSIGGFSMPETIFVDKEGMIVFHKRGPMRANEVRRRVQEAFGL